MSGMTQEDHWWRKMCLRWEIHSVSLETGTGWDTGIRKNNFFPYRIRINIDHRLNWTYTTDYLSFKIPVWISLKKTEKFYCLYVDCRRRWQNAILDLRDKVSPNSHRKFPSCCWQELSVHRFRRYGTLGPRSSKRIYKYRYDHTFIWDCAQLFEHLLEGLVYYYNVVTLPVFFQG